MSDYALQLTGGGYAAAPSHQAYDFGVGDFTVEAWIKPQAAGAVITRLQTLPGDKEAGFGLGFLPDSRLQFEVSDGTNRMCFDSGATPILDGKWHHVAGVRRGLQLQVYVDGLPTPRWPSFLPPAWIDVNNAAPLVLGGGAVPYSGLLNEVRLWNYARSREELTFALGLSLRCPRPGLAGCWSLAGGTFTDFSATRNDAAGCGPTSFVAPSALSSGVEFILDGRDYFTKLKELLLTVRVTLKPDAPPFVAQPSFLNLVAEVGRLAPVRIIMWNREYVSSLAEAAWGKLKRLFGVAALAASASGATVPRVSDVSSWPWQMPDPRTNSRTKAAVLERAAQDGANIRVYLEDYRVSDMSFTGALSSQHQKIAIFSIKGKKYALIGGVNLENRYWDDARPVPHPMYDKENYHTWHDTAVMFAGPVAAAVEREFDRRWAKSQDTGGVASDTYVKLAFYSIIHWENGDDLNLNHDWQPGQISDPGHPTAVVDAAAPVPVQVLVTNHERQRVSNVLDQLLERIAAARRYVFLEDFCFHHIQLVQALADRMQAQPDLQVIILVPHSYLGQDGLEDMESFLTRQAFLALSIPFATAVTFGDGTRVTRGPGYTWQVGYGEPWLGELVFANFVYGPPGEMPQGRPLSEIADLSVPAGCRLVLCAPVRRLKPEDCHKDEIYGLTGGLPRTYRRIYVHSKLALFDEEYAVVGSANYNQRSQEDDGELSVAIHDPAQVSQIRQALFEHYGMNTVADWTSRMQQFAGSTEPGIGVIAMAFPAMCADWGNFLWEIMSFLPNPERAA